MGRQITGRSVPSGRPGWRACGWSCKRCKGERRQRKREKHWQQWEESVEPTALSKASSADGEVRQVWQAATLLLTRPRARAWRPWSWAGGWRTRKGVHGCGWWMRPEWTPFWAKRQHWLQVRVWVALKRSASCVAISGRAVKRLRCVSSACTGLCARASASSGRTRWFRVLVVGLWRPSLFR